MSDYELKDIRTDLLEPSAEVPVVIDFWAPWCGPCKTLGPVLEKLAAQAKGRWKFVKVNVDEQENQQLAAQFQIRSIPAVRMLYQGKILGSFEGALSEAQVKQWLKTNLPEREGQDEDDDEQEDTIESFIEKGDRESALNAAKKAYDEDKNSDDNKIQLALLLLPSDPDTAMKLIEAAGESGKYELEKESILTIRHLQSIAESGKFEGDNSKQAGSYVQAAKDLFDFKYESALERFINIVMIDRKLDDDGARKACIAIFQLLGEKHPVSQAWRRRFSMALY
ncbi:MAG: tetratricopeptide repeat protein [Balneolia bacterium]|nr:tetratricopeptide repeat protein [Balneolia bacterium]